MGQRINPLGFRLGVTQNHRSHWFAQKKYYSEDLQEDEEIRNCIENYVRRHMKNYSNYGGIARVEIRRKIDLIQVEIHIGFPNLLIEDRGRGIEQLRTDVRNMLNSANRKLNISIAKVAKPYGVPNILAEYIALQLEDRVSFRKTVKKAIELAEQADIRGIKYKLQDVSTEMKLPVLNGPEEVGFPYRPFELELIIAIIRLKPFMEY